MPISPRLLAADESGRVTDSPRLLMLASRGGRLFAPSRDDLIPLPKESELFLLPGRAPIGLNPRTGKRESPGGVAAAAFAAPGHTLSAHPACVENPDAPALPLFAYGAVGYANGRFWICAQKVDNDPRQNFSGIPPDKIDEGCEWLLNNWPANRLVGHIINNCVRKYSCPAARNFALGRYEAPLPSSQSCGARCLGCISEPQEGSHVQTTPQCRIAFTPSAEELAEVMLIHESREKSRPVYSFGQGCEGDPLVNAPLLCESVRLFRKEQAFGRGGGTVNCNTNAAIPEAVELLAQSGLTSIRVSLNSSQPELYEAYYRPRGYDFSDVVKSMRAARKAGLYVALNLLYFPGLTDTQKEFESLAALCAKNGVSMIQWRNLNADPYLLPRLMGVKSQGPSLGLRVFMAKLKKACPWLDYGYFNPYLGARARIKAPELS